MLVFKQFFLFFKACCSIIKLVELVKSMVATGAMVKILEWIYGARTPIEYPPSYRLKFNHFGKNVSTNLTATMS